MKVFKIINKKYTIILFIAVLAGILSCEKDDIADTTAPGILEVTDVISTNGGAKIAYNLPDDDDVLFVKAKYTNSLGNEVFKVASHYLDTIEVDGFNDTLPKNIQLYVVDRNNNHSEAVETEVTPLISFIYLVQESVEIGPDLGGVRISWTNISEKTVHMHLYYSSADIDTSVIVSSSFKNYSFNIIGLDSVEYEFSAMVEDFVGNKTDIKFIDKAIPMYEEKISKDSWTLVTALSVDGNQWEGVTQNFWDDVIDTHENASDNSYFIINRDANGGALNYPMDIVIDLNKNVLANRLIVWQRAYWYSGEEPNGVSALPYYYQQENMKAFDIYISTNAQDWVLVGQFEIEDRKDIDGNVSEEAVLEALNGHNFSFDNVTMPFRYLKFSITSSFGSEINIYGSEISLFGLDNVEL